MAVNVKMATYNAPHRLQHKGLKADIQRLADQGCEIIALQENADNDPKNYCPNGWGWIRPAAARSAALLYKKSTFDKINSGVSKVSAPGDTYRGVVWGDFRHKSSNRSVRIGSVHLAAFKTSSNDRARIFRYQEKKAADWLGSSGNRILLGDFNASPGGKWMPNMLRVGRCYSPLLKTGPQGTKIDHVWVPKGRPRPVGLSTMSGGSDHKALIARVDISKVDETSRPPAAENPSGSSSSSSSGSSGSGSSGSSTRPGNSGSSSNNGASAAAEDDVPATDVSVDISNKPFRFNPPLHTANFHQRVELVSKDQGAIDTYEENKYRQRDYVKGLPFKTMTSLRLGRITMGDTAVNGAFDPDFRWGFRFLFNPTDWQGGQMFSKDINPDFASNVPLIVSVGLEKISMRLLLDRGPDLDPKTTVDDYLPPLGDGQLKKIRKMGTLYDLDFLFRVANVHRVKTKDGQTTADYGLLLPNICYLHLGKMRFKGRMFSIVSNHLLFTEDMVPIRTMVTIEFQRVTAMSAEDFDEYTTGAGWDVARQRAEQEARENEEVGTGDAGGSAVDTSGTTYDGDINKTVPYTGSVVDPDQRYAIATAIVRTAMVSNELGGGGEVGKRAALIGLIAAQVESLIQNLDNGYYDHDSVGVFQQRPASGWGTPAEINIVQNAIDAFFGLSVRKHTSNPGLLQQGPRWYLQEPGSVAQDVQRSAKPLEYAKRIPEMEKLLSRILRETGLR